MYRVVHHPIICFLFLSLSLSPSASLFPPSRTVYTDAYRGTSSWIIARVAIIIVPCSDCKSVLICRAAWNLSCSIVGQWIIEGCIYIYIYPLKTRRRDKRDDGNKEKGRGFRKIERGERTKGRRRFVLQLFRPRIDSISVQTTRSKYSKTPHAFYRMVKNNQASKSSSRNCTLVIYVRVRVVWPFGKLPARVAIASWLTTAPRYYNERANSRQLIDLTERVWAREPSR